jgi:hypothetical protein
VAKQDIIIVGLQRNNQEEVTGKEGSELHLQLIARRLEIISSGRRVGDHNFHQSMGPEEGSTRPAESEETPEGGRRFAALENIVPAGDRI